MVSIDTIEGIIDSALWYHYDVGDDVLYIRFAAKRDAETIGEETEDGLILLRDAKDGRSVGITVVNWWKRSGHGGLPDSIRQLQTYIEPWAKRVAA